jgi:hypothetical protein
MPDDAKRPAIGSPPDAPDDVDNPDFAEEHTDMTVSRDISDHEDSEDIETESPRGIGGMDVPPNPLREA